MIKKQMVKICDKCSGDMCCSESGWSCMSCDRKVVPFNDRETSQFRRLTSKCDECDNGKVECLDCEGTGIYDVDDHFDDGCDYCDGSGMVLCDCMCLYSLPNVKYV